MRRGFLASLVSEVEFAHLAPNDPAFPHRKLNTSQIHLSALPNVIRKFLGEYRGLRTKWDKTGQKMGDNAN